MNKRAYKLMALIAIVCLVFSLAACDGKKGKGTSSQTDTTGDEPSKLEQYAKQADEAIEKDGNEDCKIVITSEDDTLIYVCTFLKSDEIKNIEALSSALESNLNSKADDIKKHLEDANKTNGISISKLKVEFKTKDGSLFYAAELELQPGAGVFKPAANPPRDQQ